MALLISLEHHTQAIEGQVFVVVVNGAQVGQQQRCGMSGGDNRNVAAGESIDVFADSRHQTIDQTGESR